MTTRPLPTIIFIAGFVAVAAVLIALRGLA